MGYWTPACETWYQKRVARINSGEARPVASQNWANLLKYERSRLKQVNAKNNAFSLSILSALQV